MSLQNSSNFPKITAGLAIASSLLVGCGGGGSSSNTSVTPSDNKPPATSPTSSNLPTNNPVISTTEPANSSTSPALTPTNMTAETVALQLLNKNRTQCGFGSLTLNQSLTNTASNHANYQKLVSERNHIAFASHSELPETNMSGVPLSYTGAESPYFTGIDLGTRLSPPIANSSAIKTSYQSMGSGENIGMTTISTPNTNYEVDNIASSENILSGLFAAPYHIKGLVYPNFKEVGISYQLAKWTANGMNNFGSLLEIVSAIPANSTINEPTITLNFPCDNIITEYKLTNESPNPFGYKDANGNIVDYKVSQQEARDLEAYPVGQPIYVRVPYTKVIKSANITLTSNGQNINNIYIMTAASDPNKLLQPYEVIFIPTSPLSANTNYQATYQLLLTDGSSVSKTFTFSTKK